MQKPEQTIGLKFEQIFSKSVETLSKTYAYDPVNADVMINNFVIGQLGNLPITPIAYFQKCGDSFLYPQTCDHKINVIIDLTRKRNEYYNDYKKSRQVIITSLTENLKKDPDRQKLLSDFEYGFQKIQAIVNQEFKRIQSLKKFEAVAWSIFTFASNSIAGATGNQKILSATNFAIMALQDLSQEMELDFNSLHRFSEEPANFSNKSLTKGSQWDHIRSIVTLLHLSTEYEIVYLSVFPEMRQQPENLSINTNLLFFLGAVLLLKK